MYSVKFESLPIVVTRLLVVMFRTQKEVPRIDRLYIFPALLLPPYRLLSPLFPYSPLYSIDFNIDNYNHITTSSIDKRFGLFDIPPGMLENNTTVYRVVESRYSMPLSSLELVFVTSES
jgi:hypothetical protein